MKIFIDFDGVIFNTELFKKQLIKIFSENGISKKDFDKSYQQFKNKKLVYSAIRHIKFFTRNKKVNLRRFSLCLEKLFKNSRLYVFNDVKSFLEYLPKNSLYLLSYGDFEFQRKKIEGTGINRYFNRIIISNRSKIKIIKAIAKKDRFNKAERTIFIDDKPENIEDIKQKNIITIQLIRPPNKSILKFSKKADFRVRNFREIKSLLFY